MYNSEPDLSRLRQGDVLASIILPRFRPDTSSYIYEHDAQENLEFSNQVLLGSQTGFAVVISQCCEFNEGKRGAFSIASLTSVFAKPKVRVESFGIALAELLPFSRSPFRGGKVSQSHIDALREANEMNADSESFDNVNAYLYDKESTQLQEAHVVDFTRITSVSMKSYDYMLSRKVLQLSDDERRLMQLKLGYFFARRAEE